MSRRRRLPSQLAPVVTGALLSGFMSLIVSGVATLKASGLTADFGGRWLAAWALAWRIAFSVVLMVGPMVRRLLPMIVEPANSAPSRHLADERTGA